VICLIYLAYLSTEEPKEMKAILPEGGFCIQMGLPISYTTIDVDDGYFPIEYCKLSDFCEEYEYSVVLDNEEYDQENLDEFTLFMQESEYTCFQDEAQHTQRYSDVNIPTGRFAKAKFACCSKDPIFQEGCAPNSCDGRITGKTDYFGCSIYGKEICRISTSCEGDGEGNILCDPHPYDGGVCSWSTLQEVGNTFFIEFNQCGLKVEEVCGTTRQYCCDVSCTRTCTAEYDYPTGRFIDACGGYKEEGLSPEVGE